jgi:hypothetical protein
MREWKVGRMAQNCVLYPDFVLVGFYYGDIMICISLNSFIVYGL